MTEPPTKAYTAANRNRNALDDRLRAIIARVRWVSRGVRTGAAIWPVPAAIAAALLIDATSPLPAALRAAIAILIIALALRVILGLIPARAARRMTALRAARLAEDRAHISHNTLINALQLRTLAATSDTPATVQSELARRAVAQGDERARSLPLKGMIDTAPLRRTWAWSLAALAAFAVFWLASPRLFAMGMPRLIQPFADHPPYSPTDFDISWEPSPALAGDALTIRAHLSRTLPRSLELVAVDEQGRPLDRSPMTAQIDPAAATDTRPANYTAIVRDLRAPFRFFLQGDTGRSRTITVAPEMRPRILAAELRVTPPAYTNLPEIAHTGLNPTADRDPIPVLLGSTITFRARTTVELESVNQPGSAATAGASVSGRDAVQQTRFDSPGRRTLTLQPVAVGGLTSHDTAAADILIVEDRPPSIRIERPVAEGEIFVLQGAAFPIEAVATDDVALSRLILRHTRTRQGDEQAPVERAFPIAPDHARSAAASATITTTDLGAAAGDAIALSFIATDNRAPEFGGPQSTTSATITVRVLSREDFARQFAEQLTAQDITRPYEQLARAADDLDDRAQDLRAQARELSRDVDRLSPGDPLPEPLQRSARDLQQRLEQFARQRDALADEVRRRLEAPDAVEFDRQMREPLERLLDRLEAMQTPDLPQLGEQSPPEGGNPESQQQQQQQEQTQSDQPPGENPQSPQSPGEQSQPPDAQQLDRAQVGQWLDKVEQATEQDAQQAALAADETQLDLTRPARALELADQLQRTLEQVDDAARRQRMLADRLATLADTDDTAREELAAAQESIQSQINQAIRDLRTLGDRAAHELGSSESPTALARAILDQRAKVQQSIDDITAATAQLPEGLAGESIRALIDNSANLVMDEVYRQTLPVTDELAKLSAMPARDDDPAAASLAPAIDAVREALQILEQVEQYLDEARDAYEQSGGGTVALRNLSEALVITALAASPDLTGASSTDADILSAIEEARLRIHRLRATLRQAELGMTPLLPTMGASAQSLAESVVYSDAPDAMESAASALRANDLTLAAEQAREAAEALEALYQDPGQSQPGESGQPDIDQELQLRKPSDSQSQSGTSQSSSSSQQQPGDTPGQQPTDGHSMSNAQQPSTLDQLAQNRAQQKDDPSQQSQNSNNADPNEPPAPMGGAGGNGSSGGGQPGQPSSPGDISQEAEEGQRQRSRFFNEMLYQESELPPELIDGAITEGLPGNHINRAPGARAGDASASSPAIPRGLDAPGAAAFIHVPDAYKDVVAAYFERIARESQPHRDTP